MSPPHPHTLSVVKSLVLKQNSSFHATIDTWPFGPLGAASAVAICRVFLRFTFSYQVLLALHMALCIEQPHYACVVPMWCEGCISRLLGPLAMSSRPPPPT